MLIDFEYSPLLVIWFFLWKKFWLGNMQIWLLYSQFSFQIGGQRI